MGVGRPKNFVTIVNRFPVDYQRFARLTKLHLSPILTKNLLGFAIQFQSHEIQINCYFKSLPQKQNRSICSITGFLCASKVKRHLCCDILLMYR